MCLAPIHNGTGGIKIGWASCILILVAARRLLHPRRLPRRLLRRLLPRHQHPAGSRRITRAFRLLPKSSIAPVPSGRVQQTARFCATVKEQAAPVLKFFIAIASCMYLAPIHNGTGGTMAGHPSDLLILVVVRRRRQRPL